MKLEKGVGSIKNVCDVEVFKTSGSELTHPDLFIEVPHGATREEHYRTVRGMLSPHLPDDLIDYFFVNTDVGSTELARRIAEMVAASTTAPRCVLVLRCLIPRTFIDTNRVIEASSADAKAARLTTAIPEYVRDSKDANRLLSMYRQYHDVAARAYDWICGAGGLALMPHTYAPRAIQIDSFDEGIGKALRRAYEPEQYAGWKVRPAVDLITEDPEGVNLAPEEIVRSIQREFAEIGIEATENCSYHLHPISMAHWYSTRYPGKVLCIEVSRDLLADPFSPFEEMLISDENVTRIAGPVAAAFTN